MRLPIRRTVPQTYRIFFAAPISFIVVAAASWLGFRLFFASTVAIADQIVAGGPSLVWLAPIDFIVAYGAFILCLGMLVVGAAQVLRGEPFAIGSAFARALGCLRRTLIATLPIGAVFLLFLYGAQPFTSPAWWLVAVVVGLADITVLAFTIPACVLEGRGVVASIARSFEATRGNRARLFLSWFVAALPITFAAAVLNQADNPVFGEIAHALAYALQVAGLSIHTVVAFHAVTETGAPAPP